MTNEAMALARAIEIVGGPTKMARKLGVTPQAISQWDRAPSGRVIQIEQATGGEVTREDLRPDMYPPRGAAGPAPEAAA